MFSYKMLSVKTWPVWRGNPKDGVTEILLVINDILKVLSSSKTHLYIYIVGYTTPMRWFIGKTHE